jgi:hypothetical protein
VSTLIDQAERNRFVQEQAKNISVIAPAGVGKTTSIVNRIVHLAHLPEAQAIDRLSRLIVVTYSVRAAQQMQQKARVAIRAAAVSTRVQRAFQQTFFGTIHSYCVRLLERFGHYLGLPSPVGLLQDDTELWHRFLLRGLGQGISRDANLRDLFHFYAPEKLTRSARKSLRAMPSKSGRFPPCRGPAFSITATTRFILRRRKRSSARRNRRWSGARLGRGAIAFARCPSALSRTKRRRSRRSGPRPSLRCTTGCATPRWLSGAAWPMPTKLSGSPKPS